jgi:phosphoglycolate phosphatase-like HAD superfamily hydrolase
MDLIVFDIDGTLIQFHPKLNDAAYVRAVKDVLGVVIEDSWTGFVTSTDSGILDEIALKHLGRPSQMAEVQKMRQRMEHWLDAVYGQDPFQPTSGGLELWKALQAHSGYAVAVATGNWDFSGRFKLANAGFELGDVPVASADDGIHRAELLQVAAERAQALNGGAAFERITYVGDWIWDVRAAKALGWDFVGIGNEEIERALKAEGAQRVLRDFKGLLAEL